MSLFARIPYDFGNKYSYDLPQHTIRIQRYVITALAPSGFSAAE